MEVWCAVYTHVTDRFKSHMPTFTYFSSHTAKSATAQNKQQKVKLNI